MPQSSLNIDIPSHIATCPHCRSSPYLWVDAWDAETRQPLPFGAYVDCVARDDAEGELFDLGYDESAAAMECRAVLSRHDRYPYIYWLPLEVKVWEAFAQHCRVDGDTLVYEPPPTPPDVEMRRAGAAMLPGLEAPDAP